MLIGYLIFTYHLPCNMKKNRTKIVCFVTFQNIWSSHRNFLISKHPIAWGRTSSLWFGDGGSNPARVGRGMWTQEFDYCLMLWIFFFGGGGWCGGWCNRVSKSGKTCKRNLFANVCNSNLKAIHSCLKYQFEAGVSFIDIDNLGSSWLLDDRGTFNLCLLTSPRRPEPWLD